MALFVMTCIDKPNSQALRMATREAHLAFLKPRSEVKTGGPFLNEGGEMVGSLLILEVEDKAAAQAFAAEEPYFRAGLFESVDIRPWRATVGMIF